MGNNPCRWKTYHEGQPLSLKIVLWGTTPVAGNMNYDEQQFYFVSLGTCIMRDNFISGNLYRLETVSWWTSLVAGKLIMRDTPFRLETVSWGTSLDAEKLYHEGQTLLRGNLQNHEGQPLSLGNCIIRDNTCRWEIVSWGTTLVSGKLYHVLIKL